MTQHVGGTSTRTDESQYNWESYVRARDNGHSDYVKMQEKCEAYYRGDQWSKEDRDKLCQSKRPALTINMVLGTVNAMLGEHTAHRTNITFRPASGDASEETAKVLNKVMLQIAHNNNLRWKQGEVFADGLIGARGFFDSRLNFEDNLMGEVKITSPDPKEVLIDPDATEYDPREWKEVFLTPWTSVDQLAMTYGEDKVKELKDLAYNGGKFTADQIQTHASRFSGVQPDQILDHLDDTDPKRRLQSVRVIDRQHRQITNALVLVDPTTGDWKPAPAKWTEEQVMAFAQRANLAVTRRKIRRVRWTVTAGHVTLFDGWSPYDDFTITPYFAFWRRGQPFGLVENLLSTQDQLNKTSSQELHVINTTANSGYWVPAGSLVNMSISELEQRGAETGFVGEYNPQNGQKPEKIQPNQIPSGLSHVAQKSMQTFRVISGVNDALLGQQGERASGVAIDRKREGALMQMEVPFDNFRYSMELLGRTVLRMVQKHYTEERIIRINDPLHREQNSEPVRINERDAIGNILNNITLGEYDVVVTSTPARETRDDSQFAEALQLREVGVQIPDDVVIEHSHLDGRMEIAERVRSLMGTGEPSPEQLQMAQMMQQLEMAEKQAGVQKTQAQAENLSAGALLNQMKAMLAQMQPQADQQKLVAELQRDVARLQAQLQTARESNQNKLDLADRHIAANQNKALFESIAADGRDARNRETTLTTALIQNQGRQNDS